MGPRTWSAHLALVAYQCTLSQATYPIELHTNGYTGHLIVNGVERNDPPQPVLTLHLPLGPTFIDAGDQRCNSDASFCSYFAFNVNSNGTVQDLFPASAATVPAAGTSIELNTLNITVDPGGYTGQYHLSSVYPGPSASGVQVFRLIRGLTYSIDAGPHINGTLSTAPNGIVFRSDFRFRVSANGRCVIGDPFLSPALGRMRKVRLRTSRVFITSAEVSGHTVELSSAPGVAVGAGAQVLMRGVLAWMRVDGGEFRYFVP